MRALLVFAIVLAAGGACAQPSLKTFFLVARPGLPDPNFHDSVVLVTQDENAGAIGVIINRPTDRSLADLLPGDRFKRFRDPVFFGGPVALTGLFAVFRAARPPGQAVALLPGLYFGLDPNTIDALLREPPAALRFFIGYAGWAPGQLFGELQRGDWYVLEADPETVFRKDTSKLWQELVQRARALRADADFDGRAASGSVLASIRAAAVRAVVSPLAFPGTPDSR